jgi:hypothetical protein
LTHGQIKIKCVRPCHRKNELERPLEVNKLEPIAAFFLYFHLNARRHHYLMINHRNYRLTITNHQET